MKFFLSTSIIILFGGLSFNYFNDDSRKINILRERESTLMKTLLLILLENVPMIL